MGERQFKIRGDTITIDAPVYNILNLALSQFYIYKNDRSKLITMVGVENLFIDIETSGEQSEAYAWNCIQINGLEDGWIRYVTIQHFGLSGVCISG